MLYWMPYYECEFTTPDGTEWVTTWGSCAADAGSRALRVMDARRGDRQAKLDHVYPA
jgi:hypothetical protein